MICKSLSFSFNTRAFWWIMQWKLANSGIFIFLIIPTNFLTLPFMLRVPLVQHTYANFVQLSLSSLKKKDKSLKTSLLFPDLSGVMNTTLLHGMILDVWPKHTTVLRQLCQSFHSMQCWCTVLLWDHQIFGLVHHDQFHLSLSNALIWKLSLLYLLYNGFLIWEKFIHNSLWSNKNLFNNNCISLWMASCVGLITRLFQMLPLLTVQHQNLFYV